LAVTAGVAYRAVAVLRAVAAARSVNLQLQWFKAGGAASTVRATDTGAAVVDATTGWVRAAVAAVSPSDAVTAAVQVNVLATGGAAEQHYVDKIGLARGTIGQLGWSLGGQDPAGDLALDPGAVGRLVAAGAVTVTVL
jgi:hypothetical protein